MATEVDGFTVGYGYNSLKTGDYYVYAGRQECFHVFYRPFNEHGYRVTEEEALTLFVPKNTRGLSDRANEALAWRDSALVI